MTSKIIKTFRRPSSQQIERAFAPYALEIGQLTRAWNALHDHLGQIFSQIISPLNYNISGAVWYSPPSDAAQRKMLKAAYLAWGAIDTKTHPHATDDIKWLLDETQTLGDQRNNAIHAPILVGKSSKTRDMIVEVDIFYGNPRAIKLHGKQLLKELKWYRMRANALKNFSILVWLHLKRTDGSWPERPLLPTLGQTDLHRPLRHKNGSKSTQPQP